ncbi:MAG: hypothetical protein U1E56_09910 [Bauldia sp.]
MGVPAMRPTPTLAERVAALLPRVECRRADSDDLREAIYRLRYDAYNREGTIPETPSRRLSDRYDGLPNCYLFALFIDDRLASSIRLHVASLEHPDIPANQVFGEILAPTIAAGRTIIDPTRFVSDAEMARLYSELPFLTLRIPHMAAEFFAADIVLATVRSEHQAFYQRVFGHRLAAPPAPYPSLTKPISLMALDYPQERQNILRRYPFFASTAAERRSLFDRGGEWPRHPAAPSIDATEFPAFAGLA